mmetsp:Transcript_113072/g.365205  ORF Transcript_113072/g.365205 Transcript_113072/m.365205 type:complete len:344 (+) Transcript_113072:76-1107(+)
MSEEGSDGVDADHTTAWMLAPVVCALLLAAGAVAGVVRALRQGGRVACGGIPLPRCRWLTSRWAVRIAAWGALSAGLADLILASRWFLLSWHKEVPPNLLSVLLVTYMLLGASPLILAISFRWRAMPHVHGAFVQAAKVALLGGLAAGIASEVLCEMGESTRQVPKTWRQCCATLGASSGLLLLGIYGLQADVQGAQVTVELMPAAAAGGEPELEIESAHSMGMAWQVRPRWPSWRQVMELQMPLPGQTTLGEPLLASDTPAALDRAMPAPASTPALAGPEPAEHDQGDPEQTSNEQEEHAEAKHVQAKLAEARRSRPSPRRLKVCRVQQHLPAQAPRPASLH